jgi:hypothetical protein
LGFTAATASTIGGFAGSSAFGASYAGFTGGNPFRGGLGGLIGNIFGACSPGDDTCSIHPTVVRFSIPIFPGGGTDRGEFFIQKPNVFGYGQGDNRGPDPFPNPGRSRAFYELNRESGEGIFRFNPSCIEASGGLRCKSALPTGQGNELSISIDKNAVRMTGKARNSITRSGAIDFDISVVGNPDDIVASGAITPFPSLELSKTVNGVITRYHIFHESPRGEICLYGLCGTSTFSIP